MFVLPVILLIVLEVTPGAIPQPRVAERTAVEPCNCEGKNEAATEYGPPWACPKFPLMTLADGTIYYCDYFETSNCTGPAEAAYVIGEYDYPWANCTQHCETAGYKGRGKIFNGLDGPVPEDYMHTQEPNDTPLIPGGPARHCCKVNGAFSGFYIDYQMPDDTRVYAKVLEFLFNPQMANGGSAGSWESYYVAFEFKPFDGGPPAGTRLLVKDVARIDKASRYSFAHRGKVEVSTGSGDYKPVLILLAR